METLKTILLFLFIAWGAIAGYKWFDYKDNVPPEAVDELVDERTRVQSAQIVDIEDINKIIRYENERMADRIAQQEETIVSLTRAAGQLDIYRDSIQVLQNRFNISDITTINETGQTVFADTTITSIETFSDNLFKVTCSVTFSSSGCIAIGSSLEQQRDIHITYALVDRGSGYLNAYLHLPDFNMQETMQFTYQPEPEQDKSFWQQHGKQILTYGLGAVVITTVIRALIGG